LRATLENKEWIQICFGPRCGYRAGGSAVSLLQPLLDNQVGLKNMEGADKTPISMEKAINIIHDVFISAAEREIHTGDGISLKVITKDGIKCQELPLRRD